MVTIGSFEKNKKRMFRLELSSTGRTVNLSENEFKEIWNDIKNRIKIRELF